MFTTFQKAVLASIAAAALVLALVIAAKGPAAAFTGGTGTLGGSSGAAAPVVGGGAIAPGVVTTGDATVKVKPDIAIVTVGAVAQASTAADAQAAIAERVDRIIKQAKALGIADKDMKTTGYQIQPQYASGPGQAPRLTGYQASQQMTVTFRDVGGLGKALDSLTQNDAANTVSVRLAIEDPKPAAADARRLAIADARAKADAMAKAAGVSLGRVLAITDLSGPSVSSGDLRSFAGASPAATQIPTGDLDVTVRVQLQFEIQ